MRTKPITYRVPSEVCQVKVLVLRDASTIPPEGDTPERVSNWLLELWKGSEDFDNSAESMWVVFLNTRRKITGCQKLSDGTADTLLVMPGSVFKPAILMDAKCVVLAHNHPSGDPTPSEADIRVTRELQRAGQLLKIEVMDHLVLAPHGTPCESPRRYCSMRELGYFSF